MRIIGVLYVKSSACCITTHLCCTIISIFDALSALIFVASTLIYVVSTQQINFAFKFVSGSTFSITPYSDNLTLLFGPTTPQDLKLRGTKARDGSVFANDLTFFHKETQRALYLSYKANDSGSYSERLVILSV